MLGLNVCSFIDVDDIDFYSAQRSLAKKMGMLDKALEREENTLDQSFHPAHFAML